MGDGSEDSTGSFLSDRRSLGHTSRANNRTAALCASAGTNLRQPPQNPRFTWRATARVIGATPRLCDIRKFPSGLSLLARGKIKT